MSRDQLNTLFKQYEEAFDKLDLQTVSDFCADTFISAGPKGIETCTKKEYADKADELIRFYKSIGRRSARIVSQRMVPICDKYSMIVIRWGVIFEKMDTRPVEFDISYIVYEGEQPKILLLILHEDEEAILKKLGLNRRNNN